MISNTELPLRILFVRVNRNSTAGLTAPVRLMYSSCKQFLPMLLGIVAFSGVERPVVAQLAHVEPAAVGLDSARLAGIDQLVAEHMAKGRMPGCVVTIGRHGKIAFQRAYGHRQLRPDKQPMAFDTVFDLASLTKPIATATSIMILIDRGKLRLRDRSGS